MTYLPRDDDDLFEYEPEDDVKTSTSSSTVHQANSSNISSDYVDAVKETLKNTSVDIDSSGVNHPQVALSTAFYNGTHHWINNDSSVTSFVEGVTYVLDKLTNEDYSKIRYFKQVEFRLAKKILVNYLMTDAFSINDSSDYANGIQSVMEEMFDIKTSEFYMNICYTNLYDLNKHSIHLDRIIYTALAADLDLPTLDVLFSDDPSLPELYKVTDSASHYHQKVQNMLSSIINSDILQMARLDEDTQVNYRTKEQD
jgi:hypothetical protein